MTWNTLPERAVLDAMRQAANIHVRQLGKWFVTFECERDVVWFLQEEAAETFADELAADQIEQELV